MLHQDINGPFDVIFSICGHPVSLLNRLFGRRSSEFLTDARLCNFTFYPPIIGGDTTDEVNASYVGWEQFVAHCRFVYSSEDFIFKLF